MLINKNQENGLCYYTLRRHLLYNYRLCCVMENTEIGLADTRNKVTFMFA